MDDAEKRLVAWHEAGHAIVQGVLDDGTVPVHKVTIIPRGQSLGSTTYLPTKDILTRPRKRLLDEIAMAMGGRIAEELVTGDFSNGAYGDIKQATRIARAMVCDYGMSDLGPVAMGENQDTVFLGRDITRSQHISEDHRPPGGCGVVGHLEFPVQAGPGDYWRAPLGARQDCRGAARNTKRARAGMSLKF